MKTLDERLRVNVLPEVAAGGGPGVVPGFEVGHWNHPAAATGCTAVICRRGARAAVSVGGGAAGARELEPLDPGHVVEWVSGCLLTGGSAFGLDAAGGVMRWLEEQGTGFPTTGGVVPIVPAAVIYDLVIAGPGNRPDADAGYRAAVAARAGPTEEGSVGAGRGATVGKILGYGRATKGGLGAAHLRDGRPVPMGALVVVNAFGDVFDPDTGAALAGPRPTNGPFADTLRLLIERPGSLLSFRRESTTLSLVAIGADVDRTSLQRIARMAQQGIARTIRPTHTRVDGDVSFAMAAPPDAPPAPGEEPWEASLLGALAAELVARASARAVREARGLAGIPAASELPLPPGEGGPGEAGAG